jgi:hypothetical protein
LAETVFILFEYQKRDERNETVTQHRIGDPLIFPVRMWATIVKIVRSYQTMSSKAQSTISSFGCSKRIGKDTLDFGPEGVGLH